MIISFERQLEIRFAALESHKKCAFGNRRPVDMERVIANCGYSILCMNGRLDGVLGFTAYFRELDKYLIVIDKHENGSPRRLKWTLAHEVGHIVCGHFKNDTYHSLIMSNDCIEREANIFADELLMPTTIILAHGLDTPRKVSNFFDVSLEAATNKLKYMDSNAVYIDFTSTMMYSDLMLLQGRR